MNVVESGYVYDEGDIVDDSGIVVRPVLYISLES